MPNKYKIKVLDKYAFDVNIFALLSLNGLLIEATEISKVLFVTLPEETTDEQHGIINETLKKTLQDKFEAIVLLTCGIKLEMLEVTDA